MPEIINSKTRKARKEHTCNFCGEKIRVGEAYNWSKLVYDHTLYEWKTHRSCAALAQELDMYHECDDGVTDEDFREFVEIEYSNMSFPNESKPASFSEQLIIVKQKYGL